MSPSCFHPRPGPRSTVEPRIARRGASFASTPGSSKGIPPAFLRSSRPTSVAPGATYSGRGDLGGRGGRRVRVHGRSDGGGAVGQLQVCLAPLPRPLCLWKKRGSTPVRALEALAFPWPWDGGQCRPHRAAAAGAGRARSPHGGRAVFVPLLGFLSPRGEHRIPRAEPLPSPSPIQDARRWFRAPSRPFASLASAFVGEPGRGFRGALGGEEGPGGLNLPKIGGLFSSAPVR